MEFRAELWNDQICLLGDHSGSCVRKESRATCWETIPGIQARNKEVLVKCGHTEYRVEKTVLGDAKDMKSTRSGQQL